MFAHTDLMQLVDFRDGPCLSLYMPTHKTGSERRQDEIRHKNLLRDAQARLAEDGTSPEQVDEMLRPVAEVPRNHELWEHRNEGMAIFSAPGFFRCYSLPATFSELVLIDDHFHVSPLVSSMHDSRRFFVLALTKDSADLYEATRRTLDDCDLPELAPVVVDGVDQTLQFHSQRAPTQGKGRTGEVMFHGQGGPDDREKTDIQNFFKRQVEPEVTAALKGQNVPLVLACVDYLVPFYRAANSYDHLIDGHVSGSPTVYSEEVLRESAWQLVSPLFLEMEDAARQKYGNLSNGDRTLDEPTPVLRAARNGRVETLFVSKEVAARTVELLDGELTSLVEIVEEAVEQTLRNGGQVIAVDDVPGKSAVAAVLRF